MHWSPCVIGERVVRLTVAALKLTTSAGHKPFSVVDVVCISSINVINNRFFSSEMDIRFTFLVGVAVVHSVHDLNVTQVIERQA